jgi:hypothetical protein
MNDESDVVVWSKQPRCPRVVLMKDPPAIAGGTDKTRRAVARRARKLFVDWARNLQG